MSISIPKIFLYLSFHAVGFFFMMAGMLGTPGDVDQKRASVNFMMTLLDVILSAAWYGIPVLFVSSVICFIIKRADLGKWLSVTSMALGFTLVLGMIVLYIIK